MKITVLGCGGVGKLWLSALYKKGHEVQGWLRIPQSYCDVHLLDGTGKIFNASLIANDPNFLKNSDLLLVTLKAWQVADAVNMLATSFLPDTSPILLLHNGMGTIEELKNIKQPLLVGTTTHAVRRDNNEIIHIASGITHIGSAQKQEENNYRYLADTLHEVLPIVVWHEDIFPQLWKKLAINCVINPLGSLWNCPNGQLKHHANEIVALCKELAVVLENEGVHTSEDDIYYYIDQLIDKTRENISSMLQDIRRKRRTEIDYITGYLIRSAQTHSIQVPENIRLFNIIKEKEHQY